MRLSTFQEIDHCFFRWIDSSFETYFLSLFCIPKSTVKIVCTDLYEILIYGLSSQAGFFSNEHVNFFNHFITFSPLYHSNHSKTCTCVILSFPKAACYICKVSVVVSPILLAKFDSHTRCSVFSLIMNSDKMQNNDSFRTFLQLSKMSRCISVDFQGQLPRFIHFSNSISWLPINSVLLITPCMC